VLRAGLGRWVCRKAGSIFDFVGISETKFPPKKGENYYENATTGFMSEATLPRRGIKEVMRLSLIILLCLSFGARAEVALPVGANPPALEFAHFPTRMHALVWRNWNLVETDRIAKVLETSAENVRAAAASMGLPAEVKVPANFRTRLYLSIIRRNWHLLPYEQLLTLLDMSSEQLSQTLREDDFLWIKLGSLKPKCEKIVYSPPDAAALARCAEIKAFIDKEFPAKPGEKMEPPLAFLDLLSRPIADSDVRPVKSDPDHPRYLYSYFAVFGDPLLDPSLDPYPDALLQQYADLGVNGVWLHVVLRDLGPSADFPEFGVDCEKRLANLAKLVARAKRFNIGVYLYMNEPRAMPAAFFKKAGRAEMAGVVEGDHTAMCTSNPTVRKWLAGSLTYVFKAVPDLAGVFTITASENLTNCASHGQAEKCVHCKDRQASEIIAEVNATIEAGVHAAAPGAKVIAWDWCWPDAIAPEVIKALPASVWLQSVSEWSLPLDRGGVQSAVGEYSISAVGPGPRATKHWALAKARGFKTIAKVQASNTWELSAVPYLPVYDLVAKHAANLAKADVDGVMLSWSLGGYPSPNLEIFQRVMGKEDAEKVLDEVAERTFGKAGAAHARKAWSLFSQAFTEFPYSGETVYTAPLQFGPANLLFDKPTRYRATMIGFPYDDLGAWRGPYSEEAFIGQFKKLRSGWQKGLAELEAAVAATPAELSVQAHRELRLAQAAGIHFASVLAQSQMVRARNKKAAFGEFLEQELRNAQSLYELQSKDSRIGFEASNHYYYLPQDLQEKALNCRMLLDNPRP
jgi:hypothetical protein